jgi:NAD(P)-dependent dehydrogenase (short-subunit alcohol dehydrogenase family)
VIVIVDVHAENGNKVAKEVSEKGVNGVFKKIDLSDMAQVKDMVLSTVKEFGRLDVRNAVLSGSFPEV